MIIDLPPPEERKAILSEFAARFPERFDFSVSAENGKPDKVPVLIGVPDVDESMQWEATVGATFKPRKVQSDNASLVAECVLWPDLKTWGGIVKRWPALPEAVYVALRRKFGGGVDTFETPSADEEAPSSISLTLKENPQAVWRRFKPDGESFDLVIAPPNLTTWRIFSDEMDKDGAKYWPLVRDLASTSLIGASPDLFKRYPGAAILVALVSSGLAGLAADYEKKEF